MGLSLGDLAAGINGGFRGYAQQEQRKTDTAMEQRRLADIERSNKEREIMDGINKQFLQEIQGGNQPGLNQATPAATAAPAAPAPQAMPDAGGGRGFVNPDAAFPQQVQQPQQPQQPAAAAPGAGLSAATPAAKPTAGQQGDGMPADDVMYRAYRNRTNAFARAGLMQPFQESFTQSSALGARMRSQRVASAMARLNAGDASGVSEVYSYLNDGKSVTGVQPVKVEGTSEPSWKVSIKSDDGRTSDVTLSKAQLYGMLQTVADPSKALEIEMAHQKTLFETDQKIRAEKDGAIAKGEEERKTVGVKGTEERKTEGVKGANTLANTRERGNQDRQTNEAADKLPNKGKGKSGSANDEKLHKLVQDVVGEPKDGPMGGTRIGNEDTLNIASYAKALQEADPELSDLAAVRQSVNEFKKRKDATGSK